MLDSNLIQKTKNLTKMKHYTDFIQFAEQNAQCFTNGIETSFKDNWTHCIFFDGIRVVELLENEVVLSFNPKMQDCKFDHNKALSLLLDIKHAIETNNNHA